MKKNRKRMFYVSLFLLLFTLVVGGTWILNLNIHNARAAEEDKLVTDSIPEATQEEDADIYATTEHNDNNENGVLTTGFITNLSEIKTSNIQIVDVNHDVKANDPSFVPPYLPGEKDLSLEEAGLTATAFLKDLGANVKNGRMEMIFSGSFGLNGIDRDVWTGVFYPADHLMTYHITIDSITGQLYNFSRQNETTTMDRIISQSEMESELWEVDWSTLNDSAYEKIAEEYLLSYYPDKQITSTTTLGYRRQSPFIIMEELIRLNHNINQVIINTNLSYGYVISHPMEEGYQSFPLEIASATGYFNNYYDLCVSTLSLCSDNSGYQISVGWNSKEIYEITYIPCSGVEREAVLDHYNYNDSTDEEVSEEEDNGEDYDADE